jgi:hypothetical protein
LVERNMGEVSTVPSSLPTLRHDFDASTKLIDQEILLNSLRRICMLSKKLHLEASFYRNSL